MPLLTKKLCSTILMPIKLNFNQSGAGVSFSPGTYYDVDPSNCKNSIKTSKYPHLYNQLPLLIRKICSTILMSIKFNFNQSGAGASFSSGVGLPTMMWTPQSTKIA